MSEESRVNWGSPADKKFPAKIKAWDEGYALGMARSDEALAALRAELHTAVVLGNGWKHAAQEEGAELERVTTERDKALMAEAREGRIRLDAEAERDAMRPVVEAACDHRDVEPGDDPSLDAAVDAYRLATSEQEASRCSCGKPERGRGPWHAPGRCAMYAGALDLPIEASEQEASDATTFHCYVCDAPDGECDREKHRARDEQGADDA